MSRTANFSHWLAVCVLLLAVTPASTMAAKAESAQSALQTQSLAPVTERLDIDGGPNETLPPGNDSPARRMGTRGPEENFVGMKVGSTWYDKQHNGSVGRNVAQGSDGRIHFLWMHKWNSSGVRSVYYNSVTFESGEWVLSHDTSGVEISGVNGGYCNIDVWGDLAVPAWHEGPTSNTYSIYSGIDFASGDGNFVTSAAPVGPTCSGHTTDGNDGPGNYLWPVHHVDIGFVHDPIIHAVGHESTQNVMQSFVYFRGQGNPTDWGTCGIFVDSVADIAGIVRQNPNSDDVAIVWIQPRVYGANGNQYNNDVVYVESPDGGINWGTLTKITNHVDEDLERPYANLTAMYTNDGCLHAVWDSPGYYEADGTISIAPCRLRHWDDCSQCISEVVNADNAQSCAPGDWCRNATKQNLVECEGKLYCLYSYFTGDSDEGTEDCSAGGWANAELYVSVSASGGQTWGTPVNLTNTFANGCAAGDCQSEVHPSTVMYADSLYTFYEGDTDPASVVDACGIWTECPIMFMVNPCFDMAEWVELSSTPEQISYPFHAATGEVVDTHLVLTNLGNYYASYSASVNYISGNAWLSIAEPTGSVPVGCGNQLELGIAATGPPGEGLYQAEINVSYSRAILTVPVDLYVFDQFYEPESIRLRTSTCALTVQQTSRVGVEDLLGGFHWFVDSSSYLRDGSLIIGNSRDNLSLAIYQDAAAAGLPANPWKRLYAISDVTVDTGSTTLRTVSGSLVNYDSTIQVDVVWYADGFPDTNDFFVGHFVVGPGPNWSVPLNDVVIAYAIDFDIPADIAADNLGYVDAAEQTLFMQGLYPGSADQNDQRFGGIAYYGHDEDSKYASGGVVWDNARYVYPDEGYHVDSLWAHLPGQNSWDVDIPDSSAAGDDLNAIIVVDNSATIDASTNIEFNLIFWGINPHEYGSGTYADILDKAERFICNNISPDAPLCDESLICGDDHYTNCTPGDADGNGIVNISDAIVHIVYIFGGGPPPRPYSKCSGDANGDCTPGISDAVYVITYIFSGGQAPVSCENWEQLGCDPGAYNPGPW